MDIIKSYSNNTKINASLVNSIGNIFKEKSKADYDTPNEFSNGNTIRFTEFIVILFILFIWILSLRKLIKNFEKLRTTHYREIPYKYRIANQTNTKARAYEFQSDKTNSPNKTTFRQQNIANETNKKVVNFSGINDELQSKSILEINKIDQKEIEYIDTKVIQVDENENEHGYLPKLNKKNSELINPALLLSPLVRTSIIDLHRRSMENLANINNESSSIRILTSKKKDICVKKKNRFFLFFGQKASNEDDDEKQYKNYDDETKL